ncbi:MAG: HAD family phosphatase [archaeon]
MIKLVIFDMDGVIIDSSKVHYENWNAVFDKKFGITLDKKEFGMQFGRSGLHFTEYFLKKYHIDMDPLKLKPEILENHDKLKHKIKLKIGVIDTLQRLSKRFKIALATGAGKDAALEIVNRFKIKKYFDYIIGGDEVHEAKPDPEIFLKCAQFLEISPKECVVVEDAQLGLMAAKKAGMLAISIPDEFTKHQDHSMADIHLKSFLKLTPEILKKL